MIVCSCNVLTDNAIREACASLDVAPRTPGQVYRCLGCSAQCGRCSRTIKTIIEQAVAVCPAACAVCPGGHAHAHNENDIPQLSDLAVLEAAE
ncbi:bacterioferritin [Terrihabitans soli]|uniref:Bacterioferritin-associated ferredoxin n=1 Tax=Terrihabitans soli TaxID=708113 RepID=A0A6S6QZ00_9HYPH|nr:(2Fe-2S)-binding protein [Terrihabitans soli]BCJ91838.1 bacterioferritin [Terrihabitans soli]